jgi:hypothetical protein
VSRQAALEAEQMHVRYLLSQEMNTSVITQMQSLAVTLLVGSALAS